MTCKPRTSEESGRAASKRGLQLRRALRFLASHKLKFGCLLVSSLVFALFVADELTSNAVPRAVRCLGVELSELEPAAARSALLARAHERMRSAISLKAAGRAHALIPAEAGLAIDVDGTLSRALRVGREQGLGSRFARWLGQWFGKSTELPPLVRVVDRPALAAALLRIQEVGLTAPFGGGLRVQGTRLIAEYPRTGQRLNAPKAEAALLAALSQAERSVELELTTVLPALTRAELDRLRGFAAGLVGDVLLLDFDSPRRLEFSAEEVASLLRLEPADASSEVLQVGIDTSRLEGLLAGRRASVESAARAASFVVGEGDRVRVVPSEPEARLVLPALADALLTALATPNRRGALPLARALEASFTTEAAHALGIRGLVSTFSTRHACCERRVENIHRIADLLDGVLVRPGETCSLNASVGARTAKNGFVNAPTIEEGEFVDSIGGGISQFATTFFNALFYGGYAIIERQPHTYWFPRYPMGHEATLSFPKPDLVFRNDTRAGLLIDTQYTDTRITVRLFGDNEGRKVRAEVSPRQNLVPPEVEILPNPEVPPDEERVKEAGASGWSVVVGRVITLADGTSQEERRKVTYKPKKRRVEVHPCRVPEGEKGHTGEPCPTPEASEAESAGASP